MQLKEFKKIIAVAMKNKEAAMRMACLHISMRMMDTRRSLYNPAAKEITGERNDDLAHLDYTSHGPFIRITA